MKKFIILLLCAMSLTGFTACDDYLNIVPKGSKIPKSLGDFEALLRDEYTIGYTPLTNGLYLLNDQFMGKASLTANTLARADYMWDGNADRIELNSTDEDVFYRSYSAISSCNLIEENVPASTDATEAQKQEVMAYAKVIRALCYFNLVNYYAATYDPATAASTRGVPLITSADIDAPYEQVSVQRIYDYVLQNVNDALAQGLPDKGMTIIHPSKGAAYALLARVSLQMQNYDDALKYASLALAQNDKLFDWVSYYNKYKDQVGKEGVYPQLPSPMGYDYVENYYFRCCGASPNYQSREASIPVERAARFEKGDARFLSRWKLRTVGEDTYYYGMDYGYFNYGGMTTCEMYLIKAECLARQAKGNDFTAAMQALDAVRKTRILPEDYKPSSPKTLAEAISLIRRTKDNELIFSFVPFADARRFNHEKTYARTMTKEYDGKTYTLAPDSHLWTMPFPQGAVNNPGNGRIEQNVDR